MHVGNSAHRYFKHGVGCNHERIDEHRELSPGTVQGETQGKDESTSETGLEQGKDP